MIWKHECELVLDASPGHVAKPLNKEAHAGAFVDPVLRNQIVGNSLEIATIRAEVGSVENTMWGVVVDGVVKVPGLIQSGMIWARIKCFDSCLEGNPSHSPMGGDDALPEICSFGVEIICGFGDLCLVGRHSNPQVVE